MNKLWFTDFTTQGTFCNLFVGTRQPRVFIVKRQLIFFLNFLVRNKVTIIRNEMLSVSKLHPICSRFLSDKIDNNINFIFFLYFRVNLSYSIRE
jgi:hypothetical protein